MHSFLHLYRCFSVQNKRLYIKSIILIVLCQLICSAGILFFYYQMDAYKNSIEEKYGRFDFSYMSDMPADEVLRSEKTIIDYGTIQICNTGILSIEDKEMEITIGLADHKAFQYNSIILSKGRYAEEQEEAIIEESLMTYLYPDKSLGDFVNIRLTEKNKTVEMNVRIVGIIADYSLFRNTDSGNHPYPNIYLCSKNNMHPIGYIYNIVTSGNYGETINKISSGSDHNIVINKKYDLSIFNSNNTNAFFSIIFIFFTFIIFLVSQLNIENKSICSRNNQFIKAGFSKKKIERFFYLKYVLDCLIASAFTLIVYFAICLVCMPVTNHSFEQIMIITFSIVVIVTDLAFFAVLSIKSKKETGLLIKNQRDNSFDNTIPELRFKSAITKTAWKVYSYSSYSNKKTTISVFLAVTVFAIGLASTSVLLSDENSLPEYDVRVGLDGYYTDKNGIFNLHPFSGIPDYDAEKLIFDNPKIQTVGLKKLALLIKTESKQEDSIIIDSDMQKALNISPDSFYSPVMIKGVNKEAIQAILRDYHNESANSEKSDEKTGVYYFCDNQSECMYKAGEKVEFLTYLPNANNHWETNTICLTIIDVIDQSTVEEDFVSLYLNGFVFSEEAFSALGLDIKYSELYIKFSDSAESSDYYDVLNIANLIKKYYTSDVEGLIVNDNIAIKNDIAKKTKTAFTISVAITATLLLFALFCQITSISIRLEQRKREIATLQAEGLSISAISKIYVRSCIFEIGIPLIFADISGSAIVIIILKITLSELSRGKLSVFLCLFFSVLYFSIAVAASYITIVRIIKKPITERLRSWED